MPSIEEDVAGIIVEKLKDIIKQDINFMDTTGKIIASTSPNRIGDIHFAAKLCIKQKSSVTVHYDNEYPGSKIGINLPVYLNERIVGVIGITGNPDEVGKYGDIIAQMTEILITQNWIQKSTNRQQMLNNMTVDNLINGFSVEFGIPAELTKSDTHACIIGKPANDERKSLAETNDLTRLFYSDPLFRSNSIQGVYYDKLIIITSGIKNQLLKESVTKLHDKLVEEYDLNLFFGVSSTYTDLLSTKTAYKQANQAINWQGINNNQIQFYDNMELGLLLSSIEEENIEAYKKKVLKDLTSEEIQYFKKIINIYTQHNGSIQKCARQLYIHKNTFQYQIKKLKSITSLDPRNLQDFVILYLAFMFVESK